MKRITDQRDISEGLSKLKSLDPELGRIIDTVDEVPLRLQEAGFPGLAKIIIGQQVSRASAVAIHARYEKTIKPDTPETFLALGEEAWIEIGLSRPKQKALSQLALAIVHEAFPIDTLDTLSAADAIATLTALKGIGPWTAEVYLLFCAGHPDIFPAGDLALQEAVGQAFNLEKRPPEKELRDLSLRWSPYRGIAARLFWAYYKIIKEGRGALPV